MSKPASNAGRKAPRPQLLTLGGFVLAAICAPGGISEGATEQPKEESAPEYSVVRFTTDDGLPQHEVSALSQTKDGYLWIGTWFGLARYDGLRFSTFDKGNRGTASAPFSPCLLV